MMGSPVGRKKVFENIKSGNSDIGWLIRFWSLAITQVSTEEIQTVG
jgi:hypothetical protein